VISPSQTIPSRAPRCRLTPLTAGPKPS